MLMHGVLCDYLEEHGYQVDREIISVLELASPGPFETSRITEWDRYGDGFGDGSGFGNGDGGCPPINPNDRGWPFNYGDGTASLSSYGLGNGDGFGHGKEYPENT